MAIRLICLFIGYAFGCIQSAYIIGKIVKKIDVREHGSGNAGMTNVIRVVGRRAGLVVFVCDVLKAIAAFALCLLIFNLETGFYVGGIPILPGLYAGLGVLLGHNFPFFLQFKGGKGIASSLGLMLVIDWRAALAVYALGFFTIAISRYISLGSLLMLLAFPLLLFWLSHSPETLLISLVMAAMAFYLHRGNIQRLLSGTERKLVLRR